MSIHSPRFVIGDLVRLKSGGPVMVVSAKTERVCRCQWFFSAQLHDGAFLDDVLSKVPDVSPDVQDEARNTAVSIVEEYGYSAKDQTREECEVAFEDAILKAYRTGLHAGRNGG